MILCVDYFGCPNDVYTVARWDEGWGDKMCIWWIKGKGVGIIIQTTIDTVCPLPILWGRDKFNITALFGHKFTSAFVSRL